MHCVNHGAVPGIGVCVGCRRVVCEACTTRLQGRNFCVECLTARAVVGRPRASADSPPVAVLVALLSVASVGLIVAAVTGFGFLLSLVG